MQTCIPPKKSRCLHFSNKEDKVNSIHLTRSVMQVYRIFSSHNFLDINKDIDVIPDYV